MATAASQAVSATKYSETEKIINFSPEELKAPFFLRCAALCIDYMVLLVPPVGWLIWARFFGETGTNTGIGFTLWFFGVILFLINFLVFPLMRGQTLGKMLLGLTILKTDGTKVHLGGLVRRNILGYLLTLLTLGLGFLVSAINSSGRCLHDFLAGTVVVRGRKKQV